MNLLMSLAGKTTSISNTKIAPASAGQKFVQIATTTGKIQLSESAGRTTRISERDRVMFVNLSQMNELTKLFTPTIGQDEDALTIAITKGRVSVKDTLCEQYRTMNPPMKAAERVTYNAAMNVWVKNKMENDGLQDNQSFGDLVNTIGNFLECSSSATWANLGGNENELIIYNVEDAVYGVAQIGDEFIKITKATPVDTVIDGALAFVMNDKGNGEIIVATIAEVMAIAQPIFPLTFKERKAKMVRATATDKPATTEQPAHTDAINVLDSIGQATGAVDHTDAPAIDEEY